MKDYKIDLRFCVVVLIILLVALSRLLPHPPNFSPVVGMSLFGSAYFIDKKWAFIMPLVAMWISDLILNNIVYAQYFDSFVWFYQGSLFTYGALAIIIILGTFAFKVERISSIIGVAICSSVIFFLISNFGVWFSTNMYPKTAEGLITCYTMGLSFFKNTILGDLVYTSILFGAFEFCVKKYPRLRESDIMDQTISE